MFTAVTIEDAAGAQFALFDGEHRLGEVTGLHGLPPPRTVARPAPGGHGQILETRWYGGRRPVWSGMLLAADATALWALYDELLGVLWGTVSEARTMRWTREDGTQLQSDVRLGDAFDPILRYNDRGRILAYQLVLDRDDPRNYSQTERDAEGESLSDMGGGLGFPFGFPFGFLPGGAGTVEVDNDGTIETPAVFVVHGQITNPVIEQQSTGKVIALSDTLGEGSTLEIDTHDHARTVLLDGVTDRGNLIDHPATDWTAGLIPPGGDTYRLLATSWTASAHLNVVSRDAYA